MIFLSHSGYDKKNYVKYIADKIGKDRCVYDNYTFKSGEKSIDEMIRNLDKSELFVIFISEESLNSNNVLFELDGAKKRLDENRIKKIYPIVIDENITYRDKRIPSWLTAYTLKPIMQPSVAHRRIIAKALEIRYEMSTNLKRKIFVGRNELISKFEDATLNYSENIPTTFIASGIERIGRSSFLRACFEKTNLLDETDETPTIELDEYQSLEDFIIKLMDLGYSKDIDIKNLLRSPLEEKIEMALTLIKEINKYDEKIFIKDKGAIVLPNGDVTEWFYQIANKIEQVTFAISSKFRAHIYGEKNIASFSIPELTVKERRNLLTYCLRMEKISLDEENFNFILEQLKGYPEQVTYVMSILKEKGIAYLKDNSSLLVKYNSERANVILRHYEKDSKKMEFLILLSKFDYINLDFLFEITENEKFVTDLLKKLYDESIIEYIGISKEYIRLNDTIRDHVTRLVLDIPDIYKTKLKEHVTQFLKSYKTEEKNSADFFFSMKQALLEKNEIDELYLIPSHFLKTMVELYNDKKDYQQVINLAYRVLENSEFLDKKILQEIRYYLCLSLARKKMAEFHDEIRGIQGLQKEFLLGFYNRLKGNSNTAIKHFQNVLKESPNFSRAKRELVQVYLNIEDFESAYEMAKENYENYGTNFYHIHAYLKCLIKKEKTIQNETIIDELILKLETISLTSTRVAKEMYLRAKALHQAYYLDDKEEAIKLINSAILEFPNSVHGFLEKFDILYKYGKTEELEDAINEFKEKCSLDASHKNNMRYHMMVRLEIKKKNREVAKTHLNCIKGYPENLIRKLEKQIDLI
ncbi:MAG: TIR domain-containing protein [Cetobacterium sp.]